MQKPEVEMINQAEKYAARWRVSLDTPLLLNAKRLVYKVKTSDGFAVLKLYKKTGSDGAAVPFLRGLPEGMGVKILRVSPLRSAILMEWLDGPTLDNLVAKGAAHEAEIILGQVAAALIDAPFTHPFLIPNLNKRLRRRFARCASKLQNSAHAAQTDRVIALFEMLVNTMTRQSVIHGDLHFENIICTPDGPRLIDPKGYRADPAAEFNRILVQSNHRFSVDDLMPHIQRRANVFGPAIDEDPLRLIQWAAVLWASRSLYKATRGGINDRTDPYLSAFLDLAGA